MHKCVEGKKKREDMSVLLRASLKQLLNKNLLLKKRFDKKIND